MIESDWSFEDVLWKVFKNWRRCCLYI